MPIHEVLWKLVQQEMATRHVMQDNQDDICCNMGMHHSAGKNVSTFPIGMTSFCSYCGYCWFVMVPSTKIGPISPCLLIAYPMMQHRVASP